MYKKYIILQQIICNKFRNAMLQNICQQQLGSCRLICNKNANTFDKYHKQLQQKPIYGHQATIFC
jgi:hypothetical protein